MRRYFFEVLAFLLLGGGMVFFFESTSYLAKRDYVASLILFLIGISVLGVGKELARLALFQKD